MPRRGTVSESNMTTTSEAIVGFEDETEELVRQLAGGPKHLDVVCLVGMPGIGKTTLAKRLYTHNDVISRFTVRSWCIISQVYNKRKTLLELLGNLFPLSDNTRSDDELADELRKYLLRKKYLIVIDDLWSTKVWDDLKRCFPDDGNVSSRIILTTRQEKVASYSEVFSAPHHLRLFTDEESWCLLQREVFGEESCPPELDEIGEEIAQSCKGLPLAIVLVAGVLAKLEKEESYWEWEEVAQNLSLHFSSNSQQYMDIIKLTYEQLPPHLQSCFLYFGAFSEDEEILTRKLLQIWIAEGLVQANESRILEDVAEDYLMDLIGTNLVMVVKTSSFGKIKAVRIHDLIHEFCLATAKSTNFFAQIDRSNDFSSTHLPSDLQLRLLISSEADCFRSRPDQHIRSLLSYSVPNDDIFLEGRYFFDFSSLSDGLFRSLRVLDLGHIQLNPGPHFPSEIQYLGNLRYLALKGCFKVIPRSLTSLKKLETLHIKGIFGIQMSHAMMSMLSLKHVEIVGTLVDIRFHCYIQDFEAYPPLENLKWLSFAHFPGGVFFNKMIMKLPNLVKLRCMVDEPLFDDKCIKLSGLDSLHQLESLELCSFSINRVHRLEVNFPLSLKKLTLSSYRLPWNEITVIGRLIHLEVLKLRSHAFEGEQWDVTDGEFQNLKLLKFEDIDIPQWNISDTSFPNLQRLVFQYSRISDIPANLGYLYSLQLIEINRCKVNLPVMDSIENIRETQFQEMGNLEFKLIVKSRDEERMCQSEGELGKPLQVVPELKKWKYIFCILLVLFLIISQHFLI